MKWLLYLYPRAWRKRYGAEFSALLEQKPLSPLGTADIVIGAAAARIDAVRAGSLRRSGVSLILAGLVWLVLPPYLTHASPFGLSLVGIFLPMLQVGAVIVSLLAYGCLGLPRALGLSGGFSVLGVLSTRGILITWLAYLGADALTMAHPLVLFLSPLAFLIMGLFGVVLLAFAMVAAMAMGQWRLAVWGGLLALLAPILGAATLFLSNAYRSSLAPGWTVAVYMGFFFLVGASWILFGLSLIKSERETGGAPIAAA